MCKMQCKPLALSHIMDEAIPVNKTTKLSGTMTAYFRAHSDHSIGLSAMINILTLRPCIKNPAQTVILCH